MAALRERIRPVLDHCTGRSTRLRRLRMLGPKYERPLWPSWSCTSPLASGAVPYPEVAEEPAETWTPPGYPIDASIGDGDGHPLTWARVVTAHEWLTQHATCAAATDASDATGYDSDGDQCPCTWHPAAVEERESHTHVCRAWPGSICGSCWAASCECGYVFDAANEAHSRWPNGRLRCASCAA